LGLLFSEQAINWKQLNGKMQGKGSALAACDLTGKGRALALRTFEAGMLCFMV
jgi:hypothetical protein